jgi:cyanate permease
MALVGRLVSGTGAVLLNVMLTKMTSDWFAGREIIVAMAMLVTSFPFGIGLALAVEPLIAAAQSWALAIHATAVMAFLAFILLAASYRIPFTSATTSAPPRLGGMTLREFAGASLSGIVWALYNVSYILLVTFSPPLLVARGLSVTDAGFTTSIATWILIVSVPLGGALIERAGRPVMSVASCLVLMGIAIALVGFAGDSIWAIACAGVIIGIPAGAIMALPAQALSPQSRAAGMGVFYTWYYLAMALFPAIAGLLRDLSGDPRMPLFFAAALCVVTVGTVLAFAALMRASASPEAAR